MRLVDELLQRMQEEGVTEEELSQAINKTTAGLVLQSERPSSRMFAIGHNWITRGVYDPLDDLLNRYRSVTVDSIRKILDKYPLRHAVEVQTHP